MARLVHIIVWALLLVANAGAYASWTVRYQHTDTLGSVIAESNAQGTITQRFDYKPFGEGTPTQKSGLGFTGHLEDTDLGLTYMQQRYYDPVIGRFYSNDPVGFKNALNFNRYSYANNNPYKYIDPDGRDAEITLNKNGSIKIEIPTKFSGSGATPQNISNIKSEVSKAWSGTYSIDGKDTQVSVSITDAGSVGPSNDITLTNGPTSDVFSGGNSFVDGNNTGEWRTDSGGITDGTVAHEAGHLMGIGDKYIGSTPHSGYESNIMGNKSGTPDERNIKEAINSNANWKKEGK